MIRKKVALWHMLHLNPRVGNLNTQWYDLLLSKYCFVLYFFICGNVCYHFHFSDPPYLVDLNPNTLCTVFQGSFAEVGL